MAPHSILVVGGCGFVGYHIVKALMEDPAWSSIHVMSRNPTHNVIQEAIYHKGSITSIEDLKTVLDKVRPSLVIHTASPVAHGNVVSQRSFQDININGTRNLLEAAASSDHVKALIYTSPTEVMEGSSFEFVTENAPLRLHRSRANTYAESKAVADKMVLDANGKGDVRTLCLRPAAVYGERDSQTIPGTLQILQQGRHRIQIGSNTNLFDAVSATNLAQAHILAARSLLNPIEGGLKVDGEAFFITDGDPIPFWTFERKIWSAAGTEVASDEITVIPAWFMLNLASAMEWLYWVVSFGSRRPKTFRRQILIYTCFPMTYSIVKAKERLGYSPLGTRDEDIRKGVEWALRLQADVAPST